MKLAAVIVVVLMGCGSLRDKADTAYEEGRFLEAVEMYDQLIAVNPNDQGARVARTHARNGALRVQLAYVTKVRTAGHYGLAAGQLAKLFALRDRWQMDPEPAIARLVATEVDATGSYLAGVVGNRVRTAGPLVGEKIALEFAEMLRHREFTAYRTRIASDIRSAGHDVCARITPTATTPYWLWVTNRYCTHFGAPELQLKPLRICAPASRSAATSPAPLPARASACARRSRPRSSAASGTRPTAHPHSPRPSTAR